MLVDTHVLLWLVEDDARLGVRARRLVASHSPVYYSAMSVLEMVIKSMHRKLRMPDEICSHLETEGFRQIPLTGHHAEELGSFPELTGHDPFDRALVAQARSEGLSFLTADRRLLLLGYDWILDAAQ